MAIVHYCDVCANEMTDKNNGREIHINHGKNKLVLAGHITMTVEGIDNPDLCKYCVFDVINKYDDRAKAGFKEVDQ